MSRRRDGCLKNTGGDCERLSIPVVLYTYDKLAYKHLTLSFFVLSLLTNITPCGSISSDYSQRTPSIP